MLIEKLKQRLAKIATIEICKDGYVFTLLMTGEKLDNWQTLTAIQMEILECVGDKYALIECMRNNEHFICIVLRPEDDEQEEEITEHNTKVVAQFMQHCKDEGHNLPDHLFESFFGA